jgi:hypothetical protein
MNLLTNCREFVEAGSAAEQRVLLTRECFDGARNRSDKIEKFSGAMCLSRGGIATAAGRF